MSMKPNNLLPHILEDAHWQNVQGYTETQFSKSLVIYPRNIDDCHELLEKSIKRGYMICCRGGGFTYGDMILNENQIILDTKQMNKIIHWNFESGEIIVEPGVTIASILKLSLLHNRVLASIPGGMDVTVGGAISNNVHGKDAWKNGNFGDHVISMKLLLSSGHKIEVSRNNNKELFYAVIGGMGLLGIIIEAKLQLQKIPSSYVIVSSTHSRDINESLDLLEKSEENSDFSVAWVDSFSKDPGIGRGYISCGKWLETDKLPDIDILKESLVKPKLIFGILPAKPTWFMARPFFRPWGIKHVNRIHYYLAKLRYSKVEKYSKSILFTDYNFMHNKIPDIKHVYRPHGFLEFQPLLPKKDSARTLKELLKLCQHFGAESLLCGMKAHKADNYLLSYEGDGYSIGIDIQINGRKKEKIDQFSKEIFNFTKDCGGKMFLAKDEMLDRLTFQSMYPQYAEFLRLKKKYDPQELFSSKMFQRLMSS